MIEGESSEEFLHQAELSMQWDESPRPDVLAPVGMFFGPAVRPEAVRSMPTKVELLPEGRIRLTSYFRMPFWRKANIALVNRPFDKSKTFGPVTAEVHLIPQRYDEDDTGYFCALYRDGRTEMGRDWLFFDGLGTGRFVGVVQTMDTATTAKATSISPSTARACRRSTAPAPKIITSAASGPIRITTCPSPAASATSRRSRGRPATTGFTWKPRFPSTARWTPASSTAASSDIVSHYQSLGFCYLRKQPVLRQTDFDRRGQREPARSRTITRRRNRN